MRILYSENGPSYSHSYSVVKISVLNSLSIGFEVAGRLSWLRSLFISGTPCKSRDSKFNSATTVYFLHESCCFYWSTRNAAQDAIINEINKSWHQVSLRAELRPGAALLLLQLQLQRPLLQQLQRLLQHTKLAASVDYEPRDKRVSANVDHRTDDYYDHLESEYQQVVPSLLHVHGEPCLQWEFLQQVQTLWRGIKRAVLTL